MWRFVFFLLASPAFAQDYWVLGDDGHANLNEALVIERTLACWETAFTYNEKKSCIGKASSDCMDLQPRWGQTTYGMARCTGSETRAWEQILETERRAALKYMQEADERDRENGYSETLPYRVPSLNKTHETWLAYRKAKCASAGLVARGGSMRPVVSAGCWRGETADQALFYWGLTSPW